MVRVNRSLIVIGFLSAAAQLAAAVGKTPAKPAPPPTAPAVTALLAEYQAAMAKGGEGLRTKCDYFVENKADGITPEMILDALEKQQSTDPRADVYVKWQLLSGVQGKFPEGVRARALQVYRNAPPPPDHPGIGHDMLNKALTRMGPGNADNEVKINNEMIAVIEKYRAAVPPFVAYRDEFYTRFDPAYDTFMAAFVDIYSRVSHGASGDAMWKGLNPTIRAWALKQTTPNQMQALSKDLEQLRKLVSDGKFKPYYRVMWLKEGDKPSLKWQSEGVIGEVDKMTDIGDWLMERSKSVGGTVTAAPEPRDTRYKK